MPLTKLAITDFRNFLSAQFEPAPDGFNLLFGLNGSGKTSLLEAIYYLGLGRSFRSHLNSRVIRHEADKFTLYANLIPGHHPSSHPAIPVGVERELQGNLKIRIAGADSHTVADLAQINPVQLMNSQSFALLDAGPSVRRKFMDWGCFYQTPDFLRTWRQYSQILKQRNAALRLKRPKTELKTWDHELIEKAVLLDTYRQDYLANLCPLLEETVANLLSLPELRLIYQKGWDKETDFSTILASSLDRDLQLGHTQFGPHKADLIVKIGSIAAKDILSRGQQKLFVCAMILAQGLLLKTANKRPIYLVDDLPAELDHASRKSLINLLSQQETQIFVTAVERELLEDSFSGLSAKMFHVEHCTVTEMK